MKKAVWLLAGGLMVSAGFCVAYAAESAPTPAPAPASGSVVIPSAETPKKAEETLPKVVAKVGDSEISGKDFGRQLDFIQKMGEMQQGQSLVLDDRQRYDILQSEVDKRILELLAAKDKVVVQDAEVKAEFENQKKQAGATPEEFKDYLAKLGFSEVDAMDMLRRNMTVNRFVESKTKGFKVTDEELDKNYKELKEAGELDKPEQFDVAHILIKLEKTDDASVAKAKEKMDAIRKRITGGEDFAKVAKEVSQDEGSAKDGGLMKGISKGDMVPEFEKAMIASTVGQVSEPFRTSYGWHILKVEAKHPAGVATLAEVKEKLSSWLLNKKTDAEIKKILDTAKASYKIEILLPKPAPEQNPAEKKNEPAK